MLKSNAQIRLLFNLIGVTFAVGAAAIWSWQPASVAALSRMDGEQRSKYLSNLEASEVVGYYCDRQELPAEVQSDIASSLRESYGVYQVGCGYREKLEAVEQP